MTEPEPKAAPAAREPKVIKRYTNRKLYDTVESRYVTLDEIAEMIKGGAEVKIIDNRTKEDLTSVTLAQIIFEEEKKQSQMPLALLREIIRRPGESLSGFFQKEVFSSGGVTVWATGAGWPGAAAATGVAAAAGSGTSPAFLPPRERCFPPASLPPTGLFRRCHSDGFSAPFVSPWAYEPFAARDPFPACPFVAGTAGASRGASAFAG